MKENLGNYLKWGGCGQWTCTHNQYWLIIVAGEQSGLISRQYTIQYWTSSQNTVLVKLQSRIVLPMKGANKYWAEITHNAIVHCFPSFLYFIETERAH